MEINIGFGYLFFQIGLFILHYGNILTLPLWVVFFPSIIIIGFLIVLLFFILFMLIWGSL